RARARRAQALQRDNMRTSSKTVRTTLLLGSWIVFAAHSALAAQVVSSPKDRAKCLQLVERASSKHENDMGALYSCALALMAAGQPHDAVPLIEAALSQYRAAPSVEFDDPARDLKLMHARAHRQMKQCIPGLQSYVDAID